MNRVGARGLLGALVAGVVAPVLLIAGTQSASANPVAPVLALPGVIATLNGIEAATAAATPFMVGAGTASAAVGTGVVLGGFGVGYGIGWAGQKGLKVAWDKWFTDHPIDNTAGTACAGPVCASPGTGSSQGFQHLNVTWTHPANSSSSSLPRMSVKLFNASGVDITGKVTVTFSDTTPQPLDFVVSYAQSQTPTSFAVIWSQSGLSDIVSGTKPLADDPAHVAGYRAHNETDCQLANGSIATLTGDSTSVASGSVGTADVPEVTCPPGSHAVASRVSVQPLNSNGLAVGSVVPLTDWVAAPRFTDVNDPQADCMARAGDAMCELKPYTDTNTGTRTDYDPEALRNPSTGIAPDADGCTWGTHELTATDCGAPATAPNPDPAPPGTAEPADPTNPAYQEGMQCFPRGWDMVFNPVGWVYMPIRCAFVPPPGTFEAGWSKVNVSWCDTAPGAVSCAIGDLLGPFTHLGEGVDAADCQGLEVAIPVLWQDKPPMVVHPLSACSDASQAIIAFWLPFSSGAVYLGSVLAAGRMLSKTIGADDAVPGG